MLLQWSFLSCSWLQALIWGLSDSKAFCNSAENPLHLVCLRLFYGSSQIPRTREWVHYWKGRGTAGGEAGKWLGERWQFHTPHAFSAHELESGSMGRALLELRSFLMCVSVFEHSLRLKHTIQGSTSVLPCFREKPSYPQGTDPPFACPFDQK